MRKTRSRKCLICGKFFDTPAAARSCEAQGDPRPRFRRADLVYPRYTANVAERMVVNRIRVAKGTHHVEYGLRPEETRAGPILWVREVFTFGSAEERERAREKERDGMQPRKVRRTRSAKASYRRAFRANRDMAADRLEKGQSVYLYYCRSPHHGRTMRFFAPEVSVDVTCPGCGGDQKRPDGNDGVPVEFVSTYSGEAA